MIIFGEILIVIGSILMFISAYGCFKYKNFFHQLHAAAVGDNTGLILILIGLSIVSGFSILTLKIVFLIFLVFLISPINTHFLAKAAILYGIKILK